MDRKLRQIETLGKVAGIALMAAPTFFLLSALFARPDPVPASVERVSSAPQVSSVPQVSSANADSAAPRFNVDFVSTPVSPAEMLRPEQTLSLLNLKRGGTVPSRATETAVSLFSSPPSGNVSHEATTIPGLEPAALLTVKHATSIDDVPPKDSPTNETSSQPSSADAPAPWREENSSAEAVSSIDSTYEPAWPDQWLSPLDNANQKQSTTAKLDKSKKRSPNVRIAQKEKKPSASRNKNDLSDDNQNDSLPMDQPNIEDSSD